MTQRTKWMSSRVVGIGRIIGSSSWLPSVEICIEFSLHHRNKVFFLITSFGFFPIISFCPLRLLMDRLLLCPEIHIVVDNAKATPEAQFPKLCGISPGCWFVDMCSNTQHSRHPRCRIEASLTHSKDAAGAGCSPACSGDGLHPVYAAGFHFQGFSALLQGNGVSVPSPCSWMSCTLMIAAFITTHVCESQTARGLCSVMPTISKILCNTCPCCFGFLIGCYC